MGAEAVLREQAVEAAQSFSHGRGCDAVLICADTPSADPVELAGVIARDRARVIAVGAVGLHIPRKVYYEKELTFLNSRSYGPGRYDPSYEESGQDYPIGYVRWTEGRNLEAFVDLLAGAWLDVHPLISHRFPIDQAPQAYELITGKRKEPFLGVLLTYPDAAVEPEAGDQKESGDIGTFAASESMPHPVSPGVQAVRLGVLGAGNFASAVLLPAMKGIPGIERIAIASASGVSAQHAAQRFGFFSACSNETQVIHDPQVNTVVVLTRHHLHARQVTAALEAGKHVFCEKPLAVQAEELTEIAVELSRPKTAEPLLMVGFNRRFAPLASRLKEFLSGRGEPLVAYYRVNAGFIPLNHWTHDPQQGGGRIIGEGCHFIDFLTYLVGAHPLQVTAQGLPNGGRYREDNVLLTFTFPDGSVGAVSYLANGDKSFPKERVEVFTSGRVAVLDDYRSLELVQDGRRQVIQSRLRQDKGHRGEWQAFSAAILAGGPPPIPYEQIFGVMQATFAAVEALRSGKTVDILPTFDILTPAAPKHPVE
ncbi:MAG: Gfo/Idh/MocA family oxidoreductase, partial [Anaerolineales bacterium]|nr:Gfo/Idh/MocA family oxidoreductase [Anaerolineales bacterium]